MISFVAFSDWFTRDFRGLSKTIGISEHNAIWDKGASDALDDGDGDGEYWHFQKSKGPDTVALVKP